jgi:hypothetical protein
MKRAAHVNVCHVRFPHDAALAAEFPDIVPDRPDRFSVVIAGKTEPYALSVRYLTLDGRPSVGSIRVFLQERPPSVKKRLASRTRKPSSDPE